LFIPNHGQYRSDPPYFLKSPLIGKFARTGPPTECSYRNPRFGGTTVRLLFSMIGICFRLGDKPSTTISALRCQPFCTPPSLNRRKNSSTSKGKPSRSVDPIHSIGIVAIVRKTASETSSSLIQGANCSGANSLSSRTSLSDTRPPLRSLPAWRWPSLQNR
jgi:hypothetical protein